MGKLITRWKGSCQLIVLQLLIPQRFIPPTVRVHLSKMKNKYNIWALISGTLLLIIYFLTDYLFEIFWIFYLIPLLLAGLIFLAFFIITIIKKNRIGISIGIVILGIIFSSEIASSELFKSEKILEATLMDDLSAIHLTLRENNRFEVIASNLFAELTFEGTYQLQENKIIFNDPPYDNDFIPDTVTIIEDKIILSFYDDGKPKTQFATYFDIKKNRIKNAP